MPITIRHEGSKWVVEYRRRAVAEARSQAEADELARRAMAHLVAKADAHA